MRTLGIFLSFLLVLTACVDPEDIILHGTVNVVVVDGTITNLAEPQIIRLNRSKADPLTGRPGSTPITKAVVEVIVDSSEVVFAHETVDGSYQLPADFKGQVGHAYQLRFWLLEGTEYRSTVQVMQPVAPIQNVSVQFNANSLPTDQLGGYTAGHDLSIDFQDPGNQHNYYRWDWSLYERQLYCRSCNKGVYAVNNIIPHQYHGNSYVSGNQLFEDCFDQPSYQVDNLQPPIHTEFWVYDYNCRTQCWEILHNSSLNLFDDIYSNGGFITHRSVAHIPFYQHAPCLVDIRQGSLTKEAYKYYKLFADQTQNTGGLADTPPSVPAGNVFNAANATETVVGFFTASAVSLIHQWLDRNDTKGIPYGATDPTGPHEHEGDDLFYALNARRPVLEPSPPYTGDRAEPKITIWGGPPRVPTAVCVYSDSRTPYKPAGWQE